MDKQAKSKHRQLIARIFSNENKCNVAEMEVLWPTSATARSEKDKGKKRARSEGPPKSND